MPVLDYYAALEQTCRSRHQTYYDSLNDDSSRTRQNWKKQPPHFKWLNFFSAQVHQTMKYVNSLLYCTSCTCVPCNNHCFQSQSPFDYFPFTQKKPKSHQLQNRRIRYETANIQLSDSHNFRAPCLLVNIKKMQSEMTE